ncbi:MAG: ferric reductase-like transmembrane domain-containing protein, partial [Bdellovibrionota bacterium]
KLIKWFLRLAILIWPLYWLGQIFIGDLGASPALTLSRELGFIVLTLLTANIVLGILLDLLKPAPSWIRFWVSERRWWGIVSFLVLVIHVAFYFVNEGFEAQAWIQIFTKTYLIFASISFFLLFLLAITSNNFSTRRLGPKRWKMLHRLIYLVQFLIMGHVLLIEKANLRLYIPWLLLLGAAQIIRWSVHFWRSYKTTRA